MRPTTIMAGPDETQELLELVRSGDSKAIDRLLGRHRPTLRRVVELRLDPAIAGRVDASDVVQETLVEASRRLAEYASNPAMPFHIWLRHLAKDHVIDAHRRHRAAQRRSVDRERSLANPQFGDRSSIQLASQLAASGLTPAATAMRAELERRFRDALEHLKPDDREIIVLRHFEHYTNQEVARELGLSEPAAGMRYLRALRRLGATLNPGGEETV